eukprot:6173892-Pleurochrysis_carterae.AAC.1
MDKVAGPCAMAAAQADQNPKDPKYGVRTIPTATTSISAIAAAPPGPRHTLGMLRWRRSDGQPTAARTACVGAQLAHGRAAAQHH